MTLFRLAAASDPDLPQPPEIPSDINGWALYRDRTIAMLRKYLRMSLHLGRTPSLLGGELFRARVTAYKVHTFEDVVVFVTDMESCLRRLDPLSRILIAKIVLAEYTSEEIASQYRTTRRQINRRLDVALDLVTEMLANNDLMETFRGEQLPPSKRPTRTDSDSWWVN